MPPTVLEYKCPCCDAGLQFDGKTQKLHCEYCGNDFTLEAVEEYNRKAVLPQDSYEWVEDTHEGWSEAEAQELKVYLCSSCNGELTTDAQTAATFCPYCGNPTVLPSRVSGGLKPDGVLPFRKTKEDAKQAFWALCKGKPLLPKDFTRENHIEKLTGIYVPFWLYDCDAQQEGRYKATRVHTWSDSKYHYTKTDHYLLFRGARANFTRVPMDGSANMPDAIMESIEPFDYQYLHSFDTAYLTGYFADKYDVPAEAGRERVKERAIRSIDRKIHDSMSGYATVVTEACSRKLKEGKTSYVLLPVWLLNTVYRGKTYTFAMNAQSGRMTGELPICPKRTAAWFAGIFGGAGALTFLLQLLFRLL